MDILLNQSYEINNVISHSGRFAVSEFQKEIINISKAFKAYASNNGECIITTTKAVEIVNGEQVMDLEILLPVAYRIPVEEPYVFKSIIKLVNALYVKVEEVTLIQESLNTVNQYISDHKLQPITSAYLVQSKQADKPCIDIYIGINPNIV